MRKIFVSGRSQRGSSVIEACILLLLSLQIFLGVLGLVAFMSAQLWLRHQSYEALICLAQGQSPNHCEAQLRAAAVAVVPFGQISQVRLWERRNHWNIHMEWRINSKWQLQFSHRLRKEHLDLS